MTDPTESAGGMGPYGCSEREIEIARSICDSYPVINAFTAPEWAKLDDGGKAWIATIVRQAIALGATLDTTPPSEPNPEAPTLAGPLNAVLQARADDPDTVAGQIAAMDLRTGETRTFDCMAARAILKETSDAADR